MSLAKEIAEALHGELMAKEYFVLIENGEVVSVAETYKEPKVKSWSNEKPNRQFEKVPECT